MTKGLRPSAVASRKDQAREEESVTTSEDDAHAAAEPGVRPRPAPACPQAAAPRLLPWLRELVRSTLELPEEEPVDDKTLAGLGMVSLQTVALQYQILADVGVDITVDDLLGDRDVAALARLIGERAATGPAGQTAEAIRI
jgi:Phosphopantetheine attachment site